MFLVYIVLQLRCSYSMLFPMPNIFYFYISAFRSVCAVLDVDVFLDCLLCRYVAEVFSE